MPSKGIQLYTYISVEGYSVEFTVPEGGCTNTEADNFGTKHLEVDSANIHGLGKFTGEFKWQARDPSGNVVASAYNNINSLSGNLEGGTMTEAAKFSATITDEVIITYGFYDAGHGEVGLPSSDQCYVTICSAKNIDWMGTVAPPGSQEASKPFSRFALAAPHDNGMNSMQSSTTVLSALNADMVDELKENTPWLRFFDEIPNEMLVHMLPNIVYGVAITQKKEISTMLALGARYFEFRPAKLLPLFERISKLENKFYFQHACIPGLAFDVFLAQLVEFLDTHPTEIVTIHIRSDNIVKACVQPTLEEVAQMLDEACSRAQNAPLSWGQRELFSQPIDELRSSGKRLIYVNHADKYDTWTAKAYATLEVDPILERFESMNTEGQESTDLTVLQCQATSQSIKEVLVYSVVSANAATSCLLSTKARLDMKTLPWIRQNALERLQAERLLIIMNDFMDGATTDTSIELSRQRLAKD